MCYQLLNASHEGSALAEPDCIDIDLIAFCCTAGILFFLHRAANRQQLDALAPPHLNNMQSTHTQKQNTQTCKQQQPPSLPWPSSFEQTQPLTLKAAGHHGGSNKPLQQQQRFIIPQPALLPPLSASNNHPTFPTKTPDEAYRSKNLPPPIRARVEPFRPTAEGPPA